jgi:hypothetical protein
VGSGRTDRGERACGEGALAACTWGASCSAARLSMADDPCRNVRAHAQSLEQEIELMRGVVAALRSSSRRPKSGVTRPEPRRWKIAAVAFLAGLCVGALTMIALTRYW